MQIQTFVRNRLKLTLLRFLFICKKWLISNLISISYIKKTPSNIQALTLEKFFCLHLMQGNILVLLYFCTDLNSCIRTGIEITDEFQQMVLYVNCFFLNH